MRRRSLFVALLSCAILIGILALSGCGNTPTRLQARAAPTVPYLAPTVVPSVPSVTPTTPPTPKPTATARPTSSGGPPKPSAPPPPAASVPSGPSPVGAVPNIGGQLILVSLAQQWMFAYQDHRMVYQTAVTTGMPQLPTPAGTFHVQWHEQNVTFYSPWPQGSPYYYSPEHINYAMYFLYNGYYIHDAPWRHLFGPGTNYPHTDPDGTYETGSHGCVNVPTTAMSWIYRWARDGATAVIYGRASTGPAPTPTPQPPAPTPTPTKTPAPAPTATPTALPEPTATPTP